MDANSNTKTMVTVSEAYTELENTFYYQQQDYRSSHDSSSFSPRMEHTIKQARSLVTNGETEYSFHQLGMMQLWIFYAKIYSTTPASLTHKLRMGMEWLSQTHGCLKTPKNTFVEDELEHCVSILFQLKEYTYPVSSLISPSPPLKKRRRFSLLYQLETHRSYPFLVALVCFILSKEESWIVICHQVQTWMTTSFLMDPWSIRAGLVLYSFLTLGRSENTGSTVDPIWILKELQSYPDTLNYLSKSLGLSKYHTAMLVTRQVLLACDSNLDDESQQQLLQLLQQILKRQSALHSEDALRYMKTMISQADIATANATTEKKTSQRSELESLETALTTHVTLLLMTDQFSEVCKLLKGMEQKQQYLSEATIVDGWQQILDYLRQTGTLLLDGNLDQGNYNEKLSNYGILLNCLGKPIGMDTLCRFFQGFVEEVTAEPTKASEEIRSYIVLASQQTLLKLFRDKHQNDQRAIELLLEAFPSLQPTSVGNIMTWAVQFIQLKNPIPLALYDTATGELDLVNWNKAAAKLLQGPADEVEDEIVEIIDDAEEEEEEPIEYEKERKVIVETSEEMEEEIVYIASEEEKEIDEREFLPNRQAEDDYEEIIEEEEEEEIIIQDSEDDEERVESEVEEEEEEEPKEQEELIMVGDSEEEEEKQEQIEESDDYDEEERQMKSYQVEDSEEEEEEKDDYPDDDIAEEEERVMNVYEVEDYDSEEEEKDADDIEEEEDKDPRSEEETPNKFNDAEHPPLERRPSRMYDASHSEADFYGEEEDATEEEEESSMLADKSASATDSQEQAQGQSESQQRPDANDEENNEVNIEVTTGKNVEDEKEETGDENDEPEEGNTLIEDPNLLETNKDEEMEEVTDKELDPAVVAVVKAAQLHKVEKGYLADNPGEGGIKEAVPPKEEVIQKGYDADATGQYTEEEVSVAIASEEEGDPTSLPQRPSTADSEASGSQDNASVRQDSSSLPPPSPRPIRATAQHHLSDMDAADEGTEGGGTEQSLSELEETTSVRENNSSTVNVREEEEASSALVAFAYSAQRQVREEPKQLATDVSRFEESGYTSSSSEGEDTRLNAASGEVEEEEVDTSSSVKDELAESNDAPEVVPNTTANEDSILEEDIPVVLPTEEKDDGDWVMVSSDQPSNDADTSARTDIQVAKSKDLAIMESTAGEKQDEIGSSMLATLAAAASGKTEPATNSVINVKEDIGKGDFNTNQDAAKTEEVVETEDNVFANNDIRSVASSNEEASVGQAQREKQEENQQSIRDEEGASEGREQQQDQEEKQLPIRDDQDNGEPDDKSDGMIKRSSLHRFASTQAVYGGSSEDDKNHNNNNNNNNNHYRFSRTGGSSSSKIIYHDDDDYTFDYGDQDESSSFGDDQVPLLRRSQPQLDNLDEWRAKADSTIGSLSSQHDYYHNNNNNNTTTTILEQQSQSPLHSASIRQYYNNTPTINRHRPLPHQHRQQQQQQQQQHPNNNNTMNNSITHDELPFPCLPNPITTGTTTNKNKNNHNESSENFTILQDSPALAQLSMGVVGVATVGCLALGPVGFLIGVAAGGLGFGYMQIPEEERHKIQTKAGTTLHNWKDKACHASESLSEINCSSVCQENIMATTKTGVNDDDDDDDQIVVPVLHCLSPTGTSKSNAMRVMDSVDDEADEADDMTRSPSIVRKNSSNKNAKSPSLMEQANRKALQLNNDHHTAYSSNTTHSGSSNTNDLHHHHHQQQQQQQQQYVSMNKKVCCLRNIRTLPLSQIHGLELNLQPKAWLNIVASAHTTVEQKNEAMEEILLLAKDKRRVKLFLDEGILDYILWTVSRYLEKIDIPRHNPKHWQNVIVSKSERTAAQLAATCGIALGKAHCCAALNGSGVMGENRLLHSTNIATAYGRGTVPEERQVAQMLHEVPHHARITKTKDPTIVIANQEVFCWRALNLVQAQEWAKKLQKVANGQL